MKAVMTAQPFRVNKTIVFTFLLLAYFFAYFFRISTSVVMPEIQQQWGLSATLVGFISSMYFYTYAAMQPVCGALNDRFGPLRIVGTGMALAALGSVLFGVAQSPALLIVGRLLQGIGLAPMLSGLFVYQATQYPVVMYTFLSGVSLTVGNFGAVASVAPLSAAVRVWDRTPVFIFLALVSLAISASLFFSHQTNKKRDDRKTDCLAAPAGPIFAGLGKQFRDAFGVFRDSANLRRLMILWNVTVGTTLTLQGLWAVSWFSAVYRPEGNGASIAATMIGIGVMLGNMLGGKINAGGKQHRVVQYCAYSTTAAWFLTLFCFGLKLPMPLTAAAGMLVGICVGASFTQFASAQNSITPQGRGGAVFGIINALSFILSVIFQWGTGAIITHVTEALGRENIGTAFLVAHGVMAGCMFMVCLVASRIRPFA